MSLSMEVGVNYLGLSYNLHSDAVLARDFSLFRQTELTDVAFRVVWEAVEKTRGNYAGKYLDVIAQLKRALNLAQAAGLRVNIDFHTVWESTWTFPSWALPSYSIVTNPTMQQAFLDYIAYVVNELKTYPAIRSWHYCNEPRPAGATRTQWVNFFKRCYETIKAIDDRPVTARFYLGDSPFSGDFDFEALNYCDYYAINAYFDPDTKIEPWGASWDALQSAIEHAHNRGKKFWISEYGAHYSNLAEQERIIAGSAMEFPRIGVDGAFAWAWQPINVSSQPYNLCLNEQGQGTPAFYKLALFPSPPPLIVVDVQAVNGGTTTPTGRTSYPPGSQVTITATAAQGYVFSGWLVNNQPATMNPLTLTLTESITVMPIFTPVETHICPEGYHWDEQANACVQDTPTPSQEGMNPLILVGAVVGLLLFVIFMRGGK